MATQYSNNCFQVYKNDGKNFPLIGELENTQTHGHSSNGLSKLNNKMVCSGASDLFYIICIDPLQVIQKYDIDYTTVHYIYITKDNYLYCNGNNGILQFKIINDEDNNFAELIKIGEYTKEIANEKAILPFDDGRIFFVEEKEEETYYQLIA